MQSREKGDNDEMTGICYIIEWRRGGIWGVRGRGTGDDYKKNKYLIMEYMVFKQGKKKLIWDPLHVTSSGS